MAEQRFTAAALTAFACSLIERAGVRRDIAIDVADVLVTADLLGHTTHGLALLAPYLGEIERGTMAKSGEPAVVSDRPAAQTWDGRRLPGPWLTLRALDAAAKMAGECGTGTVVIRRSHHIACLAVYLLRATERGLVAIVESSDPIVAAVVPHGGTTAVLTPNPIAAGSADLRRPDPDRHVELDHEHGIRATGNAGRPQAPRRMAHRPRRQRDRRPGCAFQRTEGRAAAAGRTRRRIQGVRPGLLVEAMTAGLSGHGRADPREAGAGRCSCRCSSRRPSAGSRPSSGRWTTWSTTYHDATPRPASRASGCPAKPA